MDSVAYEHEEVFEEQDISVDGDDLDKSSERTRDHSECEREYFK